MSAPMVRAILDDTKTKTRRVVKPQPAEYPAMKPEARDAGRWVFMAHSDRPSYAFATSDVRCPYGKPGDRLWVREAWSPDPPIDDSWASTQWNGCGRKVSEIPDRFHHPHFCNYAASWLHSPIRWTPSIHMPRWASRITLEVTGVRVERLQDISERDACAEGIGSPITRDCKLPKFVALWESIHGPGSWDANPWVWVVEFERIKP